VRGLPKHPYQRAKIAFPWESKDLEMIGTLSDSNASLTHFSDMTGRFFSPDFFVIGEKQRKVDIHQ